MDLGKMMGPLPMGAWLAVIAGGLGIGYFVNSRKSSSDGAAVLPDSDVGVGGGGWVSVPAPTAPTTPTTEEKPTNVTWGQKVTNWLISPPQSATPTVAENAVRKYLYGQNLSFAENALMNRALLQFGPPPEPLPPVELPARTGPPEKLGPIRAIDVTSDSITIEWDPVDGALGYKPRFDKQSKTPVLNTQYTFTGLEPNREHIFAVAAYNAFGDGLENFTPPIQTMPAGQKWIAPGGSQGARSHTVSTGDTLTSISTYYYRTPVRANDIYGANAAVIDQAARDRGKPDATGPGGMKGFYLYAGTTLVIPA